MNTTVQFEQVIKQLVVDFEKLHTSEKEGYFVGSGYKMYVDSSEFYAWEIGDIYIILKHNISYEIATEWYDFSMEVADRPEFKVDIIRYSVLRGMHKDLDVDQFYRMLKRDTLIKMIEYHTDEHAEQSKKELQELKDRFAKDIESYTK